MSRQYGWDAFAFGFGPRSFFWRGPRRGRRQWFESGDMKYVILKLLKDKPRHGYEVTDAGRKFLEEHRDVVDDIFERVRDTVDRALGGSMGDVNRAVGRLMKAVYRAGWRARDDATRQRLGEILTRAVADVEGLQS